MHPNVASCLNNLATLYKAGRAYAKADSLYLRALDIREKTLSTWHPDVALTLNNLAELHWAQGDPERAMPLLSRAAAIRDELLRVELARLSEPDRRSLMDVLHGETDVLISLHADTSPNSAAALDLALTAILRRKGRVLDSAVDSAAILHAHLSPPLRDQLDQLARARADLAALLYLDPGSRRTVDRAAIATARARIAELEGALAAASTEVRAQSSIVTAAELQAAIPVGAALVEFMRYRRFDPGQALQRWQDERYVAYVLTPRGPPQAIMLGGAAPIDAEIDTVLAAMNHGTSTAHTTAALRRLDALVFAPIRARLIGVTHVILAPDSKLNLVPFEALIDPQGHHALESYLMSYVTTRRDLLRVSAPLVPRSPAVIIADPDYGTSSSPLPRAASFAPLAGALAEATDLRGYFSSALTGRNATKSALAALAAPSILHIATHGFYAQRSERSTSAPAPSAPSTPAPVLSRSSPDQLARPDRARGMFVDHGGPWLLQRPRSSDPADALDRAGLALAGANQGPAGIVTARELAGLDLWGTQLVVLSACETGVGIASSGDGVYGLRRALVLAGAASQVVSLWRVDDQATRALMRDFYSELAAGTGRAEALRRAKLHLLRQPRYAHPYYWAAFIPAGDWRPLDHSIFSPGVRGHD
jgi:CHAT domain-containing protein